MNQRPSGYEPAETPISGLAAVGRSRPDQQFATRHRQRIGSRWPCLVAVWLAKGWHPEGAAQSPALTGPLTDRPLARLSAPIGGPLQHQGSPAAGFLPSIEIDMAIRWTELVKRDWSDYLDGARTSGPTR